MLRARYRLLVPDAVIPGFGMHCTDALARESLFLMDESLSGNPLISRIALATRTLPLGQFWVTSGADLPASGETVDAIFLRLEKEGLLPDAETGLSADPHRMALTIVRTCLERGAGEHVGYTEPGEGSGRASVHPEGPRLLPREPSRNGPCPCGSGRKY